MHFELTIILIRILISSIDCVPVSYWRLNDTLVQANYVTKSLFICCEMISSSAYWYAAWCMFASCPYQMVICRLFIGFSCWSPVARLTACCKKSPVVGPHFCGCLVLAFVFAEFLDFVILPCFYHSFIHSHITNAMWLALPPNVECAADCPIFCSVSFIEGGTVITAASRDDEEKTSHWFWSAQISRISANQSSGGKKVVVIYDMMWKLLMKN